MTDIWTPDLSQIGIDGSTLPEGWGWTTLSKNEEWEPDKPLSRKPCYGEFVVTPYVTDTDACNHTFESTRLVIANVSGDLRDEPWLFPNDRKWRTSLIPRAEAPHWWLFGPQGQEFFALTEDYTGAGEDLWRQLKLFSEGSYSSTAAYLRRGPKLEVLSEVDRLMHKARRRGAVARSLHRASEMFYGSRVSDYDTHRFVTSTQLAPCFGSALRGVKLDWREQVGAMDNAIRWLIMRDILPPDIYRMVAEPWQMVCKRPLHPEDAF